MAPKKQLRRVLNSTELGFRVVTPAEAGVQMQFTIGILKLLDSGFHRNDRFELRLFLS
jgi:hypothetical protein